ncbi:AbrB family transcriptional regulator [Roseovarius sp. TE539]|uniref:AbrB family transcriptional regulator n=1 Tax=Roseovarius sp. TE539 TaxID=2249812 RepID=UPI000DDD2747|nr:AbrB family transcriptional regulator [Roseovarius sp. TE539]RBI77204.1 AbrB family transcriptional regulator [Roseovarius sp. TE539]
MPPASHTAVTCALLALGTSVGALALWIGLPLPFLLGPLIAAGLVATLLPHRLPDGYGFPPWLRLGFIAVIGLMIGAQVSPALFANVSRLALSLGALTAVTLGAHALNYAIFRGLGRYDRATAFYAATPGGLFESIALGDEAGADLPRLMLQQFLRVIVVVTALPVGLSLWLGEAVGSAGGMTLATTTAGWEDLPILVAAAAAGLILARLLRLPAGQITGPIAIAAMLSLSGVLDLALPQWLVNLAQIVVGTALGMRFNGLGRRLILRGIGLSLLSVGAMLILAGLAAAALIPLTDEPLDVLLISFAPGGVTEMALVALSLEANPAFVTLHHVYRILLTVTGLSLSASWLRRRL